jgi:hypothetical protein
LDPILFHTVLQPNFDWPQASTTDVTGRWQAFTVLGQRYSVRYRLLACVQDSGTGRENVEKSQPSRTSNFKNSDANRQLSCSLSHPAAPINIMLALAISHLSPSGHKVYQEASEKSCEEVGRNFV